MGDLDVTIQESCKAPLPLQLGLTYHNVRGMYKVR
jgi:hypothetical protein